MQRWLLSAAAQLLFGTIWPKAASMECENVPMSRRRQRAERAARAECHTRVLSLRAGLQWSWCPNRHTGNHPRPQRKSLGRRKRRRTGSCHLSARARKVKQRPAPSRGTGGPVLGSSGLMPWCGCSQGSSLPQNSARQLGTACCPHIFLGGFPKTEPWDGKWPQCLCMGKAGGWGS